MAAKKQPVYLYHAEFVGPGVPFQIEKMEVRGSQVIRAVGSGHEYRSKIPTRNVYPSVAKAVAEYIRQAEQWGQLVVNRAKEEANGAEKALRECRREHERMQVWADTTLKEVRKQMKITQRQIDEAAKSR